MANRFRVSLANKCQLLFGSAVILILAAALFVAWQPMQQMADHGPMKRAQEIADLWEAGQIDLKSGTALVESGNGLLPDQINRTLTLINALDIDIALADDPFLEQAVTQFRLIPSVKEAFTATQDDQGHRFYRYVRIYDNPYKPTGNGANGQRGGQEIDQLLLIQIRDPEAAAEQVLNRIYIVMAGISGGLLAIGVFWFIATRIILTPVRLLRDYAATVSEGNINIRSDINTGDEFEELSNMFNAVLENLNNNEKQLRSINKSMDLKLNELAESNVALYEADKIKGEFLANVSHELRTPLNSIIGFAEVLQETLANRTGPVDEKRKRYAANIINSSRHLLDLITDLLDLAKIEAGRLELNVGPVSIADTCEGLINLIRPQAEKKNLILQLKIEPNLPIVQTDPGRLQQILFNLLANGIKFTPAGGTITLGAKLARINLPQKINGADPSSGLAGVQLSVGDTGPGIAHADHQRIFEKFIQLDPSTTKDHGGTGLGLTISQELTEMLQGQIELDSAPNRGTTFCLTIPLELSARIVPLMPELAGTSKPRVSHS